MKDAIRRVMLIVPPNIMPADSMRRIAEPLGPLYMASCLRLNGLDVDVYDMTCEGHDNITQVGDYIIYGSSKEDLLRRLDSFQPDLVGVSCLFSSRTNLTLEACRQIKEHLGDGSRIVVGGIVPSSDPDLFLDSGYVDFVVMWEGEERLPALIRNLNSGLPPENHLDGIAYSKEDGAKVVVPAVTRIQDIDSLPLPARDLVDMERYFSISVPFAPFARTRRVAHILCSRGCPQNCSFCATMPYWGKKLRARSVDSIIAEMQALKDEYGIEEIQFVDDFLAINKESAHELFTRMIPLQLQWCVPNGIFFNLLDEKIIELMGASGAYQLTYAVENASARVLRDIIQKNVNLANVKRMVDAAHAHDIGVHATLIIGFPGETMEDVEMNLRFPYEMEFDSVAFFMATPLPGSRLYAECEAKGYLRETVMERTDFKTANIRIPRDSPEYVMEPEEYIALTERETREYNEWARKRFPMRYEEKFRNYLAIHPEDREKILGRVT